jgi:hypothetical protein
MGSTAGLDNLERRYVLLPGRIQTSNLPAPSPATLQNTLSRPLSMSQEINSHEEILADTVLPVSL